MTSATRWLYPLCISVLLMMPLGQSALARECVAVITAGTGHHFWRSIESGALQAGSELGVDIFFRVLYDETSVDAQEQILREALEKQCIGVVLAPNSSAHRKTLDLFRQKNLPIVLIDRSMALGAVYAQVMTNNYRAGQQAAREMVARLRGEGSVTVLRLKPGVASTDAREQGFLDEIKKSSLKLLPPVYLGSGIVEIRHNADIYLQQHISELDGLFTPNESSTLGVMAEIKRKGQEKRLVHIGFDYNRYLIQGLASGEVDGLLLQQPHAIGFQGVKLVMAAHGGQPAPQKVIYTPVYYLTAENMHSAQAQQFLDLYSDEGSMMRIRK